MNIKTINKNKISKTNTKCFLIKKGKLVMNRNKNRKCQYKYKLNNENK